MVSQSILIQAPIDVVYNCIVDFESYPQFLPEVKSAKVEWVDDKEMEVAFKVNLIKEIAYTLHFELDPSRSVYWKLKRGDMMKTNSGSWELKAKSDNTTHATYAIDIGFGLWVPKMITETLTEKSLPQTLKRFKKRAERATLSLRGAKATK
ncbi:MAG: hypothetical protein A3H42_03015 [Deltaproteobacteria bacterium RIFCSPLOWO2_02_FULL_46_8]|nr:MAG: hypothetical protein A3H42_03015 [Deltaproteobacteria bacterium RIFCSPLOWO2_02_FULL_46_8]